MERSKSRLERECAERELVVVMHLGWGTILLRMESIGSLCGNIEVIVEGQCKGLPSVRRMIGHMAFPGVGCSVED